MNARRLSFPLWTLFYGWLYAFAVRKHVERVVILFCCNLSTRTVALLWDLLRRRMAAREQKKGFSLVNFEPLR